MNSKLVTVIVILLLILMMFIASSADWQALGEWLGK